MRWLAIVAVAAVVALLLSARRRAAPAAHERMGRGECSECHDQAPAHHREPGWPLQHGRAAEPLEDRCGDCHAPGSCADCHRTPPSGHTPGFRLPDGRGAASERHAVLGRLRPSACVACHGERLAAHCTGCHPLTELEPWARGAARELERWRPLLEAR